MFIGPGSQREPTRSGLDELKKREEKSRAESSKEDPLLGRTCSNVIELAAISDNRTTVDATTTRELSLDVVGEDDEATFSSDDTDNDMASLDLDEISHNDSPEPAKGYMVEASQSNFRFYSMLVFGIRRSCNCWYSPCISS